MLRKECLSEFWKGFKSILSLLITEVIDCRDLGEISGIAVVVLTVLGALVFIINILGGLVS